MVQIKLITKSLNFSFIWKITLRKESSKYKRRLFIINTETFFLLYIVIELKIKSLTKILQEKIHNVVTTLVCRRINTGNIPVKILNPYL